MTTLAVAARYALRSFRRSGQRGVLAVACVAFGVFSLVSLQLLATSIEAAVLIPPRMALGGDLSLSREGGLTDADLRLVAADPAVETVGPVGTIPARFVQPMATSRVRIFSRLLAVDPDVFPLVGDVRLREGTLGEALAAPGSVVITRDLADVLESGIGDRLRLAGTPTEAPTVLTVRGIADSMPDAGAGTILTSLETTRASGGLVSSALVRTDAPDRVAARFEARGWTVRHPPPADGEVEVLFGLALPGAGLLGLLVGGIGVANTLQVVLSRRRTEVAVLKAMGYRQRELIALFAAETALLGVVGGVLGVLGGIAGAEGLRRLMDGRLPYLLDLSLPPLVLAGGLLAGVITAVLFGLIAIVRASAIRPSTLLRQIPIRTTGRSRLVMLGLHVGLFGLFGALSSVLIGSVPRGFGVVAVGVAGLVVFGALMVGTLLLLVRLPMPSGMLRMAASNLGRHPARAASSLVALFVGTFAIAISAIGILNAQEQVTSRTVEVGTVSVTAYGISADDSALRQLADAADAAVWTDRSVPAEISLPDGTPLRGLPTLIGRGPDGASSVETTASPRGERGRAWLTQPDHALVPWRLGIREERPLALGDTLVVRVGDATARFTVGGFYDRPDGLPLVPTRGLVVLPSAFNALAAGTVGVTETVAIEAPADRAEALATALGDARPEGVVVTGQQVADMFVRLVSGLFALVLALTSLALVAGTVLIANGVGLALVERRRELGVLKAIGYSARQVLQTLILENALLGVVGGGLGVVAAAIALVLLRRSSESPITIYPGVSLVLVGVAIGLATASALLVAWRPVRARPLDVLRAE